MGNPHPLFGRTDDGRYFPAADIVWFLGPSQTCPIVVPQGFVFDISVPRWLTWLVSRDDKKLLPAAAIHDEMLADGWKRNRAAVEFYEAAKDWGTPRWRAFVLTLAVLAWTTWLGR